MANQKYLYQDADGYNQEDTLSIYVSTGSVDGDKLVKTSANGKLDLSLLPAYAFRVGFKVRAASTANVSVATPAATLDGITLAAGNRILLKNQTAGAENGIYQFNGAGVPLTRAADYDESTEVSASDMVLISEGTTLKDQVWFLVTNDTIVLGTTALDYQAWNTNNLIAGAALSLTGITLDLNYDSSLQVTSDVVGINWFVPGTDNPLTAAKATKQSDLGSTGANQGAKILGFDNTNVTAYTPATRVQQAIEDAFAYAQAPGNYYTAGAGGVTKGQLLYVSSNNTVLPYSTISAVQNAIGLAATTQAAGTPVKVVRIATTLTSVLTGATAGTRYYWTGSAYSTSIPATLGVHVWAVGTARNATDLDVLSEFVKRNSLI